MSKKIIKISCIFFAVTLILSFAMIPNIICKSSYGKTIYIDDDAIDDPKNLTWNTISEGLDNAERGDTIKIYNGTYPEVISIKKPNINIQGQSCDLFGEDVGGVIIEGSGSNNIIIVNEAGVTLSGLTVQNSGVDKTGLTINANAINIKNNIIKKCNNGITCNKINHISITNNEIINFTKTAVEISNCDDVFIYHNSILGYENHGEKGIICEHSTNVLIDDNIIFMDQSGMGIEILYLSQQNEIIRNKIENTTQGIKVWYASNDNIFTDNKIFNSTEIALNLDFGTSIQDSKIKCIGNQIINNSGYGLYMFHLRNASIINNYIIGSGNKALYLEWSNLSTINHNHILNNDDGIFQISCVENTYKNNTINDNDDGIYIISSEKINIIDNHFRNNTNAVTMEESTSNKIYDNIINYNAIGISLFIQSDKNIIINNSINNNTQHGLHLTFSKENIFCENDIENNRDTGLFIEANSINNLIYHNNFINNSLHACLTCDNNCDDGTGGNYWDDYTGTDSDGDGIGESEYNISGGNNKDCYPFINRDGWKCLADLNGHGTLNWNYVKPGSIQQGSITISNCGYSGTKLDWVITEWPDWGEWIFKPDISGENLTPEDGKKKITVTVVAPNEKSNPFSGEIVIENKHNENDTCTIDVSLCTSKHKSSIINLFLKFLFSNFSLLNYNWL